MNSTTIAPDSKKEDVIKAIEGINAFDGLDDEFFPVASLVITGLAQSEWKLLRDKLSGARGLLAGTWYRNNSIVRVMRIDDKKVSFGTQKISRAGTTVLANSDIATGSIVTLGRDLSFIPAFRIVLELVDDLIKTPGPLIAEIDGVRYCTGFSDQDPYPQHITKNALIDALGREVANARERWFDVVKTICEIKQVGAPEMPAFAVGRAPNPFMNIPSFMATRRFIPVDGW